MNTKSLIIRLIQEDLKHSQFILGLDNLGLKASETHHLELFEVVSELMKVPESAEISWGKVYSNYMTKAFLSNPFESAADENCSFGVRSQWQKSVSLSPEAIENQAELCYLHLKAIVDVENETIRRA